MVEETGKPETDEQRRDREASEYWARVAAKGGGGSDEPEQNRPQARQSEMTEQPPPPGVDPNETDPLVIITAGLRANAEAVKEGTAEAKATRREVAASDRRTEQQLETLKKYVLDNTTAIGMFTRSEQLLANAEIAKYWWGVGGFVAGLVVLEAGQLLWLHFFG
jgi:hypothetical protein